MANDPTAEPELRALDAARVGAIQARLGKAWVVVATSANVRVNGEPTGVAAGTEFPASPGQRVFEYWLPESAAVVLRTHQLPSGRRTRIADSLDEPGQVTLQLGGPTASPDELVIDDYRVRAPLESVAVVRLTPGTYRLSVTRGGQTQRKSVALAAGDVRLDALVPPPRVTPAEDPLVITKPDPGPASTAPYWQATTGGLGVVMIGVATWLVVDASGIRSDVRDAERDGSIVVGMTLAEADSLREEADAKANAGLALYVAGGAAAAAALTWWIVDMVVDSEDEAPVSVAPSSNGLVVTGSF